ncbi:MAG: DUF3014 domain-containing protein [Nevskiaceae bacterium]|nr:MAG: DUF3014 domain-containing protein [Nevskiaceae bacterium]TBR73890.1 MAG: DUF3014 domain-containing protein [Nevskiaceae bacterium]
MNTGILLRYAAAALFCGVIAVKKRKWIGPVAVVVAVLAALAGLFFAFQGERSVPYSTAAVPVPPQGGVEASPDTGAAAGEQSAPAPETSPAEAPAPTAGEPLPALDASDAGITGALSGLRGGPAVLERLVMTRIIRRIVVTVDNLDRAVPTPLRLRAAPAVPGRPIVSGSGDTLELSPANSARYQPWVAALQGLDMQAVAAVYFHYSPLFDQAYHDLGFPGRSFRTRALQVIDHLLAAPDIHGPIRLVQPKVLYRFADPDLQVLSCGQKIMVRIGPDNEMAVKRALRSLRAALTVPPGPAG